MSWIPLEVDRIYHTSELFPTVAYHKTCPLSALTTNIHSYLRQHSSMLADTLTSGIPLLELRVSGCNSECDLLKRGGHLIFWRDTNFQWWSSGHFRVSQKLSSKLKNECTSNNLLGVFLKDEVILWLGEKAKGIIWAITVTCLVDSHGELVTLASSPAY